MIPLLSRSSVRAFDARSIEVGVPGIVLMENAGRGAAEAIARRAPARSARVVLACGTGNNGGDGFVVARQLVIMGYEPRVFLIGALERVTGDARIAFDAYQAIGRAVELVPTDVDLAEVKESFARADVVVDALFGTGLDRALTGLAAEVAEAVGSAPSLRVALDVPSGIDADTGAPLGPAVVADLTLTFAFAKVGLFTPRGRAHAGEVEIVPIGVPAELPPSIAPSAELVELADVRAWLAPRGADAHKYSAGHVAVVAGAFGKLGASLLAAHAALRGGAGAATIVTWADAARELSSRVLELMVAPIGDDVAASLDAALHAKKAAVLGPGFGTDARARAAAEYVLSTYLGPLVLDADGLTLFAGRPEAIAAGVQTARVLTPHAGEAARLLGGSAADVEADRLGAARRLAVATQSIVILKGAHSVIVDADGAALVGPRGSGALATAGSGDVLAGVLGALLCAVPPREAAAAAVTLHAEAGRRLESTRGDRGVLASEIADAVPTIVGELLRARARVVST